MRTLRHTVSLFAFLLFATIARAQFLPNCDVTCSPNPNDPSYGGVAASRVMKQNARGTQNAIVAMAGGPLNVPKILGSQSYNKAIPILSLPGRGLDLNLTLWYNSRIYDVDTVNSTVTLNADRDFPSYGFRLDFGSIEYDSSAPQMILTESDGTKHALPLTANVTGGSIYDSNDSSFIEFSTVNLTLTYRDGRMVQYQPFPNQPIQGQTTLYRPVRVINTNRNYISISYVSGTGNDQHIDTITDTLGRTIKFIYVNGLLSQIQQLGGSPNTPGFDSNGVRVWANFTWAQRTLNYNFSSSLRVVSTPTNGSTINVLTACNYPNGTGYQFSYSPWGIVNRIDLVSSTGLTRSYETYNFPDTSQALSDAPAYTTLKVSPDGSSLSTWTYATTKSGTGQVTSETVSDQLGTASTFNLNTDGSLASTQVRDNTNKVLRTVSFGWSNRLITSILTTDDAGNRSSISFTYDAHGNITDKKEFDFTGSSPLRESVTTYMQAPFTDNHIFTLPQSIQVKDGAGNLKRRVDFGYDESALAPLSPFPLQNDGNTSASRGNLTSITRYPTLSDLTKKIIRTFTYDAAGNMVVAQLDCCNQKKFNFDPASQYAYLTSIVRGPDGGQQFTTGFNFNLDNGLLRSSTDENNQQTSYQYDNMYRVTTMTPPAPAGVQTTSYADDILTPQIRTTTTANSSQTTQTFDGLGHMTQQQFVDTSTGSPVSTTQFQYDAIWRRKATSNPYTGAETVVWNNVGYDALDRVTSTTPPTGGSTTFNFAGNTLLVSDPANKQRKEFFDALGRLVQVDEPGVVADHTPANNYLNLQSGGNVVLFDPYNNPLWSAGTSGTGYGPLELQDDGNLALYQFKWQTGTYRPWNGAIIPYDPCYVGGVLTAGHIMNNGQCLENTSNTTFALMDNGNLEIYDRQLGQITWQSNTWGNPGAYLIMQTDGNLVIYSSGGIALWNSGTYGSGANVAQLEDDGRLILYGTVWSTGTAQTPVSGFITPPSCKLGWGLGTTGTMGTGQCLVSRNGRYQIMLQTDGNLVLSKIDVTPAVVLWSTGTALTPFSLDVAFHTTYSYDPLDRLTSVSQAAITGQSGSGQSRSYVYDDLGRATSITTPESGTVTNYYTDASGSACSGDPLLVCRTMDARGIIKAFTYNDPLNRITGVSYSDNATPPVTYTYDTGGQAAFALGRLTKITEDLSGASTPNGQTFTYDNLGRITAVTETIAGTNYPVRYGYNAAGQITSITYPSGRIVHPRFDGVGRLAQISDTLNPTPYLSINSADYNGAGEIKKLVFGNGITGLFSYNDHLQVNTIRYYDPSAPGGTADLLNLGYDYTSAAQPNNNGRIQAIHYYTLPGTEDRTRSESFTYDSWNRLSQAQTLDTTAANTWNLQWTYDRFGNRLSQKLNGGTVSIGQPLFTVNSATNRIVGYCYDNAGNLTDETSCPTGTHKYSYDGANRLIQINGGTATYTYFSQLRIKKTNGDGTAIYIYSGNKPIAEYAPGAALASPSREYIYAGSQLLASLSGTNTTYYHPDHLSNRADTDSSGNVLRRLAHFPYGESWYDGASPEKWKFTTYERDLGAGETALDYALFRYSNPGQGRFMSADLLAGSLVAPQSLNRYAYVLNDPLNFIDPLGLSSEGPCPKGFGEGVIGWDCRGGPDGLGGGPQHAPLTDGTGGAGGGGDAAKKARKKACLDAAAQKRAQGRSTARNTASKAFLISFGVSESVMTGGGCILGGLVGGGFAAIETFGVLTGAGIGVGCVGGAMIGFFEGIPSSGASAAIGGLISLHYENKAVENQYAQDVAACNNL